MLRVLLIENDALLRSTMEGALEQRGALVVAACANADEALAVANDTEFGLGSSVWTTDPDEQQQFCTGLAAGQVFVNGMTASMPQLPFGGIKSSGIGRELGSYGLHEFCNVKSVWIA